MLMIRIIRVLLCDYNRGGCHGSRSFHKKTDLSPDLHIQYCNVDCELYADERDSGKRLREEDGGGQCSEAVR